MSNALPVSISPCPIQEAVVEIRFSTTKPADAVFGILYAKVNQNFTSTNPLPILQIPEAIRSQDPNLTYQPHYVLSRGDLNLKIGPKVLVFSCVAPYSGPHCQDIFSGFLSYAQAGTLTSKLEV